MMRYPLLALALVLTSPAAWADDAPVNYTVVRRDLRMNTFSTDLLTFEIHGTSACDNALHTELIAAGNLDIVWDRVSTFRIRQQSPKHPTAARLHVVLNPPDGIRGRYLRVTGPGINPIGGDCQVQSGGRAGTLGLFDGNGDLIGLAGGVLGVMSAYSEELGLTIPVDHEGELGKPALYFSQANCQGQAYVAGTGNGLVFAGALVGPYVALNRFWATRRFIDPGPILIGSQSNGPVCTAGGTFSFLIPADEVTEPLPFTIPFPLPIYIAPIE